MVTAASAPEPGRDDDVLENPAWWALTTHHAHLGQGTGSVRRYRDDVAIFSAFRGGADVPSQEEWDELAALVGDGGRAILMWMRDDPPPPPPGWITALALGGEQMVLVDADELVDQARRVTVPAHLRRRALGDADVPAMLALVALTDPGPFFERTIEMGAYVGVFDGDRLVAMAGERMRLPGFTEISAVCTHPDVRGLGLATVLMGEVADAIGARDETPFLNVATFNDNARALYERLGFRLRRQIAFRSVQYAPAGPPDAAASGW